MKKITGYVLVSEKSSEALEKQVMMNIDLGWVPLGGVSLTKADSNDGSYIVAGQAMVRYEYVEEKTPNIFENK